MRDGLVDRLMVWRHNAVAHRSRVYALKPHEVIARSPITLEDMQTLVDRGTRILNRYSDLFDANVFSTQMIGREDYRRVLEAVRFRRRERKAKFEAEVRRARETAQGAARSDKGSPKSEVPLE